MPAPHHSVFLQAGCPSCRPTNSVKALKAIWKDSMHVSINTHAHTHDPSAFAHLLLSDDVTY